MLDNVFIWRAPDNNFTTVSTPLLDNPITKNMFKFYFTLALVILGIVGSDICTNKSCVCRDNSKDERDFIGETVDCSYSAADVLRTDYALPSFVYSLNLSCNNITQLEPTGLLKSLTLIELYLNKNAIREIRTQVLLLPELRRLDLSDNELEYIDKEAFRDVRKLEYLNLASNKLTTQENVAFHRLSNLNDIILDNNDLGLSLYEINLFDRNGFGLTQKIKSLSISGVNLNKVPDNFFSEAYDIRKLIISKNNLSDIFEFPFTLEYLDLSDNPIKLISEEDFVDLPGLKVLKLNNLKIKEVPEFVFKPLISLEQLELERNANLTEFSPLAFGQEVLQDADNFSLERLSLMGSRLTRLDEDLAEPFGRLVGLDLQGNPWRCDCGITWIKTLQIPPEYYEHVRCGWPKMLYNSKIFELDSKYFSCAAERNHVGFKLSVALISLTISAIAVWMYFNVPRFHAAYRHLASPIVAYSLLPVSNRHGTGL